MAQSKGHNTEKRHKNIARNWQSGTKGHRAKSEKQRGKKGSQKRDNAQTQSKKMGQRRHTEAQSKGHKREMAQNRMKKWDKEAQRGT